MKTLHCHKWKFVNKTCMFWHQLASISVYLRKVGKFCRVWSAHNKSIGLFSSCCDQLFHLMNHMLVTSCINSCRINHISSSWLLWILGVADMHEPQQNWIFMVKFWNNINIIWKITDRQEFNALCPKLSQYQDPAAVLKWKRNMNRAYQIFSFQVLKIN